jgi:hypothetical protein
MYSCETWRATARHSPITKGVPDGSGRQAGLGAACIQKHAHCACPAVRCGPTAQRQALPHLTQKAAQGETGGGCRAVQPCRHRRQNHAHTFLDRHQ